MRAGWGSIGGWQTVQAAAGAPPGPAPDPTVSLLVTSRNQPQGGQVFADDSPAGRAITVNGAVCHTTAAAHFGSSSIFGTGNAADYLSMPSSDLGNGTGDFTQECWLRFYGDEWGTMAIMGTGWSWGDGGITWFYASSQVRIYHQTSRIAQITVPWDGLWHHYCLMRASGVLYWFLDGVLVASTAWTGDFTPTKEMRICNDPNHTGSYPFTGYLQDIRVLKRAAYDVAGFTPPATQF